MSSRMIILMCGLMLLCGGALADGDNPTVAILRFGTLPAVESVEAGLLDVLQARGYIAEEERAAVDAREDLSGESINLFWGDADFSLSDANLMVEEALDRGADVLLTISAPVTQLAMSATAGLEDGPVVIFTSVYNPFEVGIAEAPCIKPGHVTGVHSVTPYQNVMYLLRTQDGGMRTIGTLYNPAEASSQYGAESIAAIGPSLGFEVEVATASSLSDVALAAEGLASKGVEALLLPLDTLIHKALPVIVGVANEHDILLVSTTPEGAYFGAAIGAGPAPFYRRGVNAGFVLVGHLQGEIDIAETGIYMIESLGIGVNLDAAEMQGLEIVEQIVDWSGFVIEDGVLRMSVEDMNRMNFPEELRAMVAAVEAEGSIEVAGEVQDFVDALERPDYAAMAEEFLAELVCTEEVIAEQRAELEGGGG